MSVKIISDSTCDLSKELIEKYNIAILPLHVVLGEEEFLDGVNISPDEIYKWADAHKTTPKTSAASITDTIELFEQYQDEYDEMVCFSISGQMSTTVNVMQMAAEEAGLEDRVFVVDSMNLSTGVGLLVIQAAIMAQEGKTGAEIAEAGKTLRKNVRASFVVDTLTYLYRGGRCNSVEALAGSALRLHPEIVVADGAMKSNRKFRGKLGKVTLEYAKSQEETIKHAEPDRVFITHSGCDAEIIESVRQYIESLGIFEEILITRAGGVISSHCGPGTLGVLYIEKEV